MFKEYVEAKAYVIKMKKDFKRNKLMDELIIDGDQFYLRDCCTEVVSKMNQEQIINIANNYILLEETGFFDAELYGTSLRCENDLLI